MSPTVEKISLQDMERRDRSLKDMQHTYKCFVIGGELLILYGDGWGRYYVSLGDADIYVGDSLHEAVQAFNQEL